jgi:hypothetical protein
MIGDLLRRPDVVAGRCGDESAQPSIVRTAIVLIVVGGAFFGAAVGMFRGGSQVAFAAFKIPLATLLTLAICAPGFVALAAAFGRSFGLRHVLALELAAGARSSLVLFAMSPVLWLAIDLDAGYHLVRLGAVVAYGLAGLSGLLLLLRGLGDAPGRAATTLGFVTLFLIVGTQSAWLLRPYLGDPHDREIPLFAHGRHEGGFLGVVAHSLGPWR